MSVILKENQPKYKTVYDHLISNITNGRFKVGSRLPSERDLANKLNVNMATIRRAFKELTINGIVEKKIGSGTYLKQKLHDDWEEKTVNVVMPSFSNPVLEAVALLLPEITKQLEKKYRIIYSDENKLAEQIKSFILMQQPAIFFGFASQIIPKEILQAPKQFVVVAMQMDNMGIPSVVCDDNYGIRMLMEYLHSRGHKRIALFRSNVGNSLEESQCSVYRNCAGKYYSPEMEICATLNTNQDPMEAAFEKMFESTEKIDFTALLCLNDEIMMAALAAFYKRGIKVPDDVSVVSVGNTRLSRYCCPPVSCYDPDLKQHIFKALQLLNSNHDAGENYKRLLLINPVLIERNSVKKL